MRKVGNNASLSAEHSNEILSTSKYEGLFMQTVVTYENIVYIIYYSFNLCSWFRKVYIFDCPYTPVSTITSLYS